MEEPDWIYDTQYLVFSSGGALGFVYNGALSVLDEAFTAKSLNLYKQLRGVSGSSIGALYALFVTLGIRGQQLYHETMSVNLMKIAEDIRIGNLTEMYGLNTKSNMQRVLFEIVQKHTGNGNITFQQLYNLTNIELISCVTNVTNGKVEYHSYKTMPNLSVVFSVCASMSIPLLFCPSIAEGNMYVDGALMDNIPFSMFPIEKTLMFSLYSTLPEITSLSSFIRRFLLMMTYKTEEVLIASLPVQHRKRRIQFHIADNVALKFNMSQDEKLKLIELGAKTMHTILYPRILINSIMRELAINIIHSTNYLKIENNKEKQD